LMADDADLAQDHLERFEASVLAKRRPVLVACQACHWCGETIGPGALFCGVACHQDYEHERVTREKQGMT
jgi:hypothetical protein